MKIEELQLWVEKSWQERLVADRPSEEQQLLYVVEEFGEVAEAIRKIKGNKNHKKEAIDIGSEFADLFISLTTLANTHNVDLTHEINLFKKKIAKRRREQSSVA